MVFELLFLSYGKRLVRTDHLGEYFSRYSFKLLAFIVTPAFASSGYTSKPSEIRKSTSAVAEEDQ